MNITLFFYFHPAREFTEAAEIHAIFFGLLFISTGDAGKLIHVEHFRLHVEKLRVPGRASDKKKGSKANLAFHNMSQSAVCWR